MTENPERKAQQERKARQERALQAAMAVDHARADTAGSGTPAATQSRPAGWYAHPSMTNTQRYWNGKGWTDHIAPSQRRLAPPPDANGASTALVLGILSVLGFGFFTGVPAIVTAKSVTRAIDQSRGQLGGRGLATAGHITGLIGSIIMCLVLGTILIILTLGLLAGNQSDSTCSVVDPDPVMNPECFD